MTRMRHISGERIFRVNRTVTDERGYFQVTDEDTGVIFWLPGYTIDDDTTYKFNWERYEEELDRAKCLKTIEAELNRLLIQEPKTANILKGIEDMKYFIKYLKD